MPEKSIPSKVVLMDAAKIISNLSNIKFRQNVNYFQLTTLGVGSAAPLVADVEDDEALAELLSYTHSRGINIFLIGGGSNLVGCDEPYDGVIVRLKGEFTAMSCDDTGRLVAGGGAKLPETVKFAAAKGFGGMSKLAGIPGTVGGALRMNAGANNTLISDKLVRLRGFYYNGTAWSSEAKSIEWRYRSSGIPEDVIVTAAEFQLAPSTPEQEELLVQSELVARRRKEIGRAHV